MCCLWEKAITEHFYPKLKVMFCDTSDRSCIPVSWIYWNFLMITSLWLLLKFKRLLDVHPLDRFPSCAYGYWMALYGWSKIEIWRLEINHVEWFGSWEVSEYYKINMKRGESIPQKFNSNCLWKCSITLRPRHIFQ